MKYPAVQQASFLARPNRFIATCQLENHEIVTAHVKNTGRGTEVFLPDAQVALSYQASKTRKTDYDLIAIKKGTMWINIDSQIPNALATEGIKTGQIQLPGLKGQLIHVKREVTFDQSRFDIYFETDQSERGFVEVKGMTLENQGIGAFPDAPTVRGLKHVQELQLAKKHGYQCYLLFIVQFKAVKLATINQKMQPELEQTILKAKEDGVQVLAYNCNVTMDEITLSQQVPFELEYPFSDPNA